MLAAYAVGGLYDTRCGPEQLSALDLIFGSYLSTTLTRQSSVALKFGFSRSDVCLGGRCMQNAKAAARVCGSSNLSALKYTRAEVAVGRQAGRQVGRSRVKELPVHTPGTYHSEQLIFSTRSVIFMDCRLSITRSATVPFPLQRRQPLPNPQEPDNISDLSS